MATAGIDMGAQSTKVVILEGDRVLAAVTLQTGESGESETRQAMDEALRQARLKLEDLKSVVATSAGRPPGMPAMAPCPASIDRALRT
jgi:activator of 2-hydroxyglutaryl-CoA dehydratase